MNATQENTSAVDFPQIVDYAASIQEHLGTDENATQAIPATDFDQFQIDADAHEVLVQLEEGSQEDDSSRVTDEIRKVLDENDENSSSEAQPQSSYAKKRKKKKGRQVEGADDGGVISESKFAQLREHFEPVRKPRPVAALLASKVIGSILEDRHIPVAVEERDGVTYLNISLTTGATPIGKALDPFATLHHPVEIEMLGKFQCLGAVMFYLCGQFEAESEQELFDIREGLRTRSSGSLSDYIRGVRLKQLAGTRLVMAHAYWEAISNSKWLSEQLISTGGLPIRAEYRTAQGEYRQSHYAGWLVPVIEAIRTALIEHADYPEFNIAEDEALQSEEERRWKRR